MPPRFLVAPDSFKGTFGAAEVAGAIAAGLESAGARADRCPVADGGEGTMEVLLGALGGETREVEVHDPLRRPVLARFGLLADGRTAVVETARASGLGLVAPEERDPEAADTFGSGELIAAAIAAGATLEVLCDADVAYEDAAAVFAPQKGADAAAVGRLARRLEDFAAELPRDPRGVRWSGCAGGLSGGLWAGGAALRSGADHVLGAIGFDARLAAADAAVSGEGRFDSQSLAGKIVGTIASRCETAGRPLHLVVGEADLRGAPPAAIASVSRAGSLEEMRQVGRDLAPKR